MTNFSARLGMAVGALLRVLPVLTRDGIGLCGAASIAYGAWRTYEPAGFIVGGSIALLAVLFLSRGNG